MLCWTELAPASIETHVKSMCIVYHSTACKVVKYLSVNLVDCSGWLIC